MFNRKLRMGRKVRITAAPRKGQTGRIVGVCDDGATYWVQVPGRGPWIEINAHYLEVA